jgi:glutamyl endopeptidase
MTKSSRGPKAGSGGGKTYGYQAPKESVMDSSIEDEKQAVVTAFDHFMDALAARAGSGDTGGTTGTSGSAGPASGSGSTGQPPGGGGSGGSSAGARPSTGGATGTPYTGTPSTGTPSKQGTATDGYEAHEMSIYSQREAYRADRARETARRAQRKEVAEVPMVGSPPVQRSKHQADSNRAPLTTTKEFSPAFGSHGKTDRPTRERVSVPAAKRPETVPTDGKVAGLRPIDAYWGSFGTAVERAAVRARLDSEMLEAIIGTDERVRINDTASYPYRCICSLLITASTGAQYLGTAWLVAPRLLLTAGHCVYMSDEGGWVREIEVIPGRDADQRPYGSAVARDFRSVTGWTQDGDSDYDYGAILLPGDARYGDQLGWFGYASRGDDYLRGITVNLSGYPGDGGPAHVDGTQWFDSRTIEDVQDRQITYVADTYGGQSGAPVWEMTTDNNRYGVAIHTFGTSVHNGGTRITGDVFDNVVAWAGEVP